jgi:hypothetical protein
MKFQTFKNYKSLERRERNDLPARDEFGRQGKERNRAIQGGPR